MQSYVLYVFSCCEKYYFHNQKAVVQVSMYTRIKMPFFVEGYQSKCAHYNTTVFALKIRNTDGAAF